MTLRFFKYQATGNDFVLLDNRNWNYTGLSTQQIRLLCDRRFGIGADGLMLLNNKEGFDFEMKYYNADGREGSMCGNGGRCMVQFANHLGLRKDSYHFLAIDGEHIAEINDKGIVSLKMTDVDGIKDYHGDSVLDTGSPHYVKIVSDVMEMDVYQKGMDIRYNSPFVNEGINVNFVEQKANGEIVVRTYERGVEDETLSCGTGVTAAALVCYHNENGHNDVVIHTRGGKLNVHYDRVTPNAYRDIWLSGPAERVYEGSIELKP